MRERVILYSDLNNFFASVETILHPELKGKPLIVCGDPRERRGVVFAKNEEAKKYGILYCVLKDKTANDGHTDVFVRAEDASKINRIFDRFGIATADIGSARTEIVKSKEEQKNADIPVPDRSTTEKDKEEAFLDALLAPAPNKEEAQTQNPTQGPAAKSRPSEPTSNQREKTVRGISDPTERSRPSVRQEMKEIREEQRQRASSAQKTKDEPSRTPEHKPVPKKKKDKER